MSVRERYFDRDCTGPTTQSACRQQIADFERRLCHYHVKLADGLLDSSEGVEIVDDPDE